jgi:hypothetical protein
MRTSRIPFCTETKTHLFFSINGWISLGILGLGQDITEVNVRKIKTMRAIFCTLEIFKTHPCGKCNVITVIR